MQEALPSKKADHNILRMAHSYDKMINRVFALFEQEVSQACQQLLAETKAKQAKRGNFGTSSHDAQALGKAVIEKSMTLGHELICEVDQIISTGGADVPADAAEKLSDRMNGMLEYLGDWPVKIARNYLREDGVMAKATYARIQAAWPRAKIKLQQEFSLVVRKHRPAKVAPVEEPKHKMMTQPKEAANETKSLINRQVRPVHFEDYSGKDFERLVFEFAITEWPKVEWLGEAGGDDGRDIWCTAEDGTVTAIACANFKKPTLTKAVSDLKKLAALELKPNRVRIVAGGAVSADLRKKVQTASAKLGFAMCEIWSGSELEGQLRAKAEHLLKRFCEGHEFPQVDAAAAKNEEKERAEAAKADIQLNPEKLTDAAKKLLYAMSEAKNGDLLCSRCHDGYALTVGNEQFVATTEDRREIARWNRTIKELVEAGFIEYEGADKENLVITDEGYEAVDYFGLIR